MDFSKGNASAEPLTFKGQLATLTITPGIAEISRRAIGKLGGARDATIHLVNVVSVQCKEPTRLVNGYLYFADATDPKRIVAWSTDTRKQVAGNSHAIMFSWQQRDTYVKAKAAVDQIMANRMNC